MRRLEVLMVLGLLACACKGEQPAGNSEVPRPSLPAADPQPQAAEDAPGAVVAKADGCPITLRALRNPQPERLVALGDVHGDLAATTRALRLAGAIDESNAWIGGKLALVQTGDILDRGNDEPEILNLFVSLQKQAEAVGGAVYRLNGNHELMNAMGDFRYVTEEGYRDFAEPGTEAKPLTAEARARAFLPGGSHASRLAQFDLVTVVGDTVFVHGGVLPRFVESLEQANRDARCFLAGHLKEPPEAVLDPEGPLWTRAFSTGDSACEELTETLDKLGVARMVVGHTPQLGGVTSACDGKVWRIDTGMASFYQGPTEVLEIRASEAGASVVRVLK